MNKILIATKNIDKFKIISKLLSSCIFKSHEFYNLNDIDINLKDKKEIGDIINRSYDKAMNVYNNLEENDFEYIIGIDDGIKMKDVIRENVKDYIQDIISDKYLKEKEKVYIVRAYTFINKLGKYTSIITEIPFIYKKLNYELKIEKNTYPLGYVLRPIYSNKTAKELSEEESNSYYLKFSESKIIDAINELNN